MEEKRLDKQKIRSKYLSYRDNLTKSERMEKSKRIWNYLKQLDAYKEAECVLVYMDYRSEVITTGLVEELLKAGEKRVYAPLVEGMDIAFYEITSLEELYSGYQGIREPKADLEKLFTCRQSEEQKCFLFVPGAVFDKALGRMGYGKGFYDRFLHNCKGKNMIKAGLAYECQIAKEIPLETHDIHMDMIVTEKQVIL